MPKFAWGKVVEYFDYDFDGYTVVVVKYHADKFVDGNHRRGEYEEEFSYHISEINQSASSLQQILIAYFVQKNLGLNQNALVAGICKAIGAV